MDMTSIWLALRVLVALACVLGLIWLAGRKLGGSRAGRGGDEPRIQVLDRSSLSRHSGVAVIAVGNRRILVGFGEQQVEMLTELSPVVSPLRIPGQPPTQRTGSGVPRSAAVATRPPSAVTARTTQPPARPVRVPQLTGAEQAAVRGQSALAGSVLSSQTWKDAVHALQERTVRR
jgi:flagellar protein FliO/FliZ